MTRKILPLALLGLLIGCGPENFEAGPDVLSDELESTESTVIVGSVNWRSTTRLTAGSRPAVNATRVGMLSIPAVGSRCTAWLVGRDLVATNEHCISNAREARGAKVSFNYVDGVAKDKLAWYDCSTLVKAWAVEDLAVLRCAPLDGKLPGDVHGVLTLSRTDPVKNRRLYVIHQNCDYYKTPSCSPTKKYSPGVVMDPNAVINGAPNNNATYNADTLGGSSGSPVFDLYTHQVIALHHFGLGSTGNGRGTANAGVKVSHVRARLAEIGIQ